MSDFHNNSIADVSAKAYYGPLNAYIVHSVLYVAGDLWHVHIEHCTVCQYIGLAPPCLSRCISENTLYRTPTQKFCLG